MIKDEETSFVITVRPYQNNESFIAQTARYKIHCLTNNREIRGWTTVTASAAMVIDITPDDNVILTELSRLERRQIQVQTDFDTDDQKVATFEWDVRNLA